MSLEKRFLACRDFLVPFSEILELEILKRWHEPLPRAFQSWINEIYSFTPDQLAALENHFVPSCVKSASLLDYLHSIKNLIKVERLQGEGPALPARLQRKVGPKKRHELERMRFMADSFPKVDSIVDIGGGAGHLSAFLVDQNKRFSFCIDKEQALQFQGAKRLERWAFENLKKIRFIPCRFTFEFDDLSLPLPGAKLVVGLHGCGGLTTDTIRYFIRSKSNFLLSVGCCYQTLSEESYNISSFSKNDAKNNQNAKRLTFSKNALHLAARCHGVSSKEEMEKKIKVRSYRYALHFYLREKKNTPFQAIGNTHLKDYDLSFGAYAKKYANVEDFSFAELDEYFSRIEVQKRIKKVIAGDILRGLLGRVIEMYIVLDRALFLKESGCDVKVVQAFDREMSPRNLLIVGEN